MLALFAAQFARNAIEHDRRKLMDAGERRAQFMRDVRQKLIFELQLLTAAHIERGDQSLAFHGIAHCARQLLTIKISFY